MSFPASPSERSRVMYIHVWSVIRENHDANATSSPSPLRSLASSATPTKFPMSGLDVRIAVDSCEYQPRNAPSLRAMRNLSGSVLASISSEPASRVRTCAPSRLRRSAASLPRCCDGAGPAACLTACVPRARPPAAATTATAPCLVASVATRRPSVSMKQ
eukprot:Amastigsp_a176657_13.p3 type:complete len:160 gc:universal Amastigsp_a176657_13:530-51(-)